MNEAIAWNVARAAAAKSTFLADRRDPYRGSYLVDDFAKQIVELSEIAQPMVEQATGLKLATPVVAKAVSRGDWTGVNLDSIRQLAGPAMSKVVKNTSGPTALVGRNVAAVEIGALLGWMSTRVMGQYVPRIGNENDAAADVVYYVTPNIINIEKRFAFPPRDFRLWIALHECTHRAQFVGCSWMGDYFHTQVQDLLDNPSIDVQAGLKSVKQMLDEKRESSSADDPLNNIGPLSALASPEKRAALDRMLGLMSLLEGHAEVVMSRAGVDAVPNAQRFARVFAQRRNSAKGLSRLMNKLLGMDVKLRQYEQGAKFVRTLEEKGGQELFNRVWEKQENCPTYREICNPQLWLTRVAGSSLDD